MALIVFAILLTIDPVMEYILAAKKSDVAETVLSGCFVPVCRLVRGSNLRVV